MADKAFAAELDRLQLELSPLTGKGMAKWLDKLYGYSPEVVSRVGQILGIATKSTVDRCDKVAKDSKQCAKKKKKKKKS
jgi:hypothetical protein